jgi:hypothetical protein
VGHVSAVVEFLRDKARIAKRTGNICVVGTFLVGATILMTFLAFSQISAQQKAARDTDILEISYRQQQSLATNVTNSIGEIAKAAPADRQQVAEDARRLIDLLASNRVKPADATGNQSETIIYEITSSVIRIGAVLIGIFLIQIMVTFARYYYKIAEHLSMASALIALSGGKLSDLTTTGPLLMPAGIDFGKEPTSPVEKVLDGAVSAIKELSQKISSR